MTVERIDTMTGEVLPSLAECEATIERGVRSYIEAGEALRTIRDARLYRETHGTFEDYCRERWRWEGRYAYNLIESSAVSAQLRTLDAPAPANEAQARELVGLPAETAAQIMRTAAETGQTVTARIIRETRVQITEPKETSKETTMTAAPSRLAIPQPPRYGGNRLKHDRIISNAVIAASGLCSALDEITELDGSLDSEEAARLADDLSNILQQPSYISRTLARVVAGDAVATDVVRTIERHGWKIALGRENASFAAVSAAERVYITGAGSLPAGNYPEVLDRTMALITGAWRHDRESAHQTIVQGVGQVFGRFGDAVDIVKLSTSLSQERPNAIVAKARAWQSAQGGTTPAALAKVLVGVHNRGKRSRLLPDWVWTR